MSDAANLNTVLTTLRAHLPDLRERFAVDSLALFGSTVRSEASAENDIDILVTFQQTPGLLGFLALQEHLSKLLGRPVDLVMQSALKPIIRERVLSEAIAA